MTNEPVIMMLSVLDLVRALDGSVDCTMGTLRGMFERKVWDCSDEFIRSLLTEGVQRPICVQVVDGKWIQGNGNHRLSVMFQYDPFGEIPVVFSETGDYMMDSITADDDLVSCW